VPPSPSTRRALLLVNRKARNGTARVQEALDILTASGVDLFEPSGLCTREDLDRCIRDNAAGIDLVVAGGGDGTMNAVAGAIRDTGLPLGILPLGTANDLARSLSIPVNPVEAARVIAVGGVRQLDLGNVNGHAFLNVASIGFSVDLARQLTSEAKKRFGVLGYAAAASRILSQSRPFTAYIEHDGTVEEVRTMQMSVGNGRFYGGGMTVESSATPFDGRLDFYSLEVEHWWELVRLAPALRRGTHGQHANVRAFGTTELTIRTRRPHLVNTDGELLTSTPAHFTISRAALPVFVP
jgi:diacylglycerol kinase (ATP)